MPNRIRAALCKPAILAVALLGLSGAALATAGAASAATPITGTTSMTNVPDTTSVTGTPGPACTSSPGGLVWATDQFPTVTLSAQLLTTPADTYQVTITSDGSYISFADPVTCDALLSEGNITGSIQYTVTSSTPPSASGLKADYNGATAFSTIIEDLFGDKITSADITGGDIYDYAYQNGNYTQVGTENGGLTITGDVTAVPCTVTVTSPGPQNSVLNTAITPLTISAQSNYPGTLAFSPFGANLPKGLSIDVNDGKITGTPVKTGTSAVTISVTNTAANVGKGCTGSASFNWTVGLTAPTPAPSQSSSSTSSSSGSSSSSTFPTGGVQTGGGKAPQSPWTLLGVILIAAGGLSALSAGAAGLRRRARRAQA